ncbi:hypothetical protein [Nonomuraea sp. NEAU-A123]|uniref:hypothetical protein n=1 Tax=Nonomuraea sp. NEAU-A123 TaxID=2839649 RepID=UPI001BE3F5D3|nr:hypothetical protein [Nonomuraea sp. NEAU-A123]MBT2228637.1 hypothetical protein [Nonomuraea sp. NEAU-A123]
MTRRRQLALVILALGIFLAITGVTVFVLLRSPESVRLTVRSDTRLVPLSLPGTAEGQCADGVCRSTYTVEKGQRTRSVSVVPREALPAGVRLAYWGCLEGPGAATCTVQSDRHGSVCVTTTGPADVARRPCGIVPSPAPTVDQAGTLLVVLNTKWRVTLSGNFTEPCSNGGVAGRRCEIAVAPGKIYHLRAQFERAADPYPKAARTWDFHVATYEGCDSGAGHADAITCIVYGGAGAKTVCLSTLDPMEQKLSRECAEKGQAQ